MPRLAATAQLLEELGRRYRGTGKSAKAAPKGPRGRRRRGAGASSNIQGKILAALKSGKGLQLKEVVTRSGLDSGAVQYHLRALRAKKQVRVAGTRKEARWFAQK